MNASLDNSLRIKSHSDRQPWTRFQLGDFSVTIVSDGVISLGDSRKWFVGLKDGEVETAMRENFLCETDVSLALNIMVVDTGKVRMMFDTASRGNSLIGPTAGHLRANLASADITPARIDHIILTHAYPDHVLRLAYGSKSPVFQNAEVHISELDYRMISSGSIGSDPFAAEMNAQLSSVSSRLSMVETRKRFYGMIATDRLGFLGDHFPFPGIGHLARASVGYVYIPASQDTV